MLGSHVSLAACPAVARRWPPARSGSPRRTSWAGCTPTRGCVTSSTMWSPSSSSTASACPSRTSAVWSPGGSRSPMPTARSEVTRPATDGAGRRCSSTRRWCRCRQAAAPSTAPAMLEVFERYKDAEYLADWEAARAVHGDSTTASHLPRTAAQRSWDALARIFNDAASAPPGSVPPEPVLNIVMDATTMSEELHGLRPSAGRDHRRARRHAGVRHRHDHAGPDGWWERHAVRRCRPHRRSTARSTSARRLLDRPSILATAVAGRPTAFPFPARSSSRRCCSAESVES